MLFHEPMNSGQAEAGSFCGVLCSEERFKQPALNFRGDTTARIGYRQANKAAGTGFFMAAGVGVVHVDRSRGEGKRAAAGHGITRVPNEMVKYLLDQYRVGRDRRQTRPAKLLYRNVVARQPGQSAILILDKFI